MHATKIFYVQEPGAADNSSHMIESPPPNRASHRPEISNTQGGCAGASNPKRIVGGRTRPPRDNVKMIHAVENNLATYGTAEIERCVDCSSRLGGHPKTQNCCGESDYCFLFHTH